MREIDELYADSGEPVKESRSVSRGTALKVGGLGLAGALASFLPGRAAAAVKRKTTVASCNVGYNCDGIITKCGIDECASDGSCHCYTIAYRFWKAGTPPGACGADIYCGDLGYCHYEGDGSCPPNSFCAKNTCCGQPVCVPYCGYACYFFDGPEQAKSGPTLNHK